ncbi:Glycosyltransferase involved in cell wall bisynthesis [Pseudobutyrivibrio sp. YE44]|uniref:glycosyltransferase n=1 Tax=Pseudobutyrivibrio sp. YE44 TaxID=1520802 RepID=UPI00088ED7AA|nr:glycosyltransferase [Pseudobutyrivibrio sp. YE44]SDB46678.1 Glycosyltransferase involved in cell wall bisynthesis [Pseudobutyrivibrio sp. YE44]
MKKIAIIAPCILPVPATKGGAVEELITCLLNQNEISQNYAIDLYTIADTSYENLNYSHTKIISISPNLISSKIEKLTDKYYRTIGTKSATRLLDKNIINRFLLEDSLLEESYSAVIIENQMSTAVELLKRIGGERNYPIFFHMHNDVDIYRSPEQIRLLADAGVRFIAISKYIENQILKYASNASVDILYNGVDFDSYSITTKDNDENTKFLYAGRVIPEKGVLELVRAYNMLFESLSGIERSHISLDIIGFSDNPTKYEKQVLLEADRNPQAVKCHGRISTKDMAEKYNEFDVVVMPTINEEPFGLVALETIAKGIPLITTNSGALPEVVGDGALIVDKNNNLSDNLYVALRKLGFEKEFRLALGKKGYKLARKNVEFDIHTYYDRFVGILNSENTDEIVSVVVPVYNVEKQLERCVDSIVNQTYKNLEIILVDDGSTDSSGKMCDELAKNDSRIKVAHQKNKGLSGARNTGIDMSSGGYIFFVDSDDYVDVRTIEILMNQAEKHNAQIAACGFAYVFDGDKPEIPFTSDVYGVWSGRESLVQMMRTNNICTVAWNKLYKAQLWEGVRYPEGKYHEDEATTYKLLYKAKIVSYIPDCLYKYYQRENSIMNAGLSGRYKDYIWAVRERINFFTDKKEKELVQHCVWSLAEYIKYVYRNSDVETKKELAREYRGLIKEFGIPDSAGLKKKIALQLWEFIKY